MKITNEYILASIKSFIRQYQLGNINATDKLVLTTEQAKIIGLDDGITLTAEQASTMFGGANNDA